VIAEPPEILEMWLMHVPSLRKLCTRSSRVAQEGFNPDSTQLPISYLLVWKKQRVK